MLRAGPAHCSLYNTGALLCTLCSVLVQDCSQQQTSYLPIILPHLELSKSRFEDDILASSGVVKGDAKITAIYRIICLQEYSLYLGIYYLELEFKERLLRTRKLKRQLHNEMGHQFCLWPFSL